MCQSSSAAMEDESGKVIYGQKVEVASVQDQGQHVAQVTDHVTQFHCSVSPHYTQLGVKIVSLCVSFACKHVFLYQIFPTNKLLSQNYVLVDISTDITWYL